MGAMPHVEYNCSHVYVLIEGTPRGADVVVRARLLLGRSKNLVADIATTHYVLQIVMWTRLNNTGETLRFQYASGQICNTNSTGVLRYHLQLSPQV